jgi:hypothetical protein
VLLPGLAGRRSLAAPPAPLPPPRAVVSVNTSLGLAVNTVSMMMVCVTFLQDFVTFPPLNSSDTADQEKEKKICRGWQQLMKLRMKDMISELNDVELDPRNSRITWRHSAGVKRPKLFFHLDCSDCSVDDLQMKMLVQQSIEAVSINDTSWSSMPEAVVLPVPLVRSRCRYFACRLCIYISYVSETEGLNDQNVNCQLLQYISNWVYHINSTSNIDDFLMLYVDSDTKQMIEDSNWAKKSIEITFEDQKSFETKLSVRLKIRRDHYTLAFGDEKGIFEMAMSVSRYFTWLLEALFSDIKSHGYCYFKFRLVPKDGVSVEGFDGRAPFVSFQVTCTRLVPRTYQVPVTVLKEALGDLFQSSNILKYAVNGFKVYLLPAFVHCLEAGLYDCTSGQECMRFGFIQSKALDSGSGYEKPESENAKLDQAGQITKIQHELAKVQWKRYQGDDILGRLFFGLEAVSI